MEAAPPIDLRDIIPPVAVWLIQAGFQEVDCGPASGETATIVARWERGGRVFKLLLQVTRFDARCHLWSREQGMCFTWMKVQDLAQVQQLLSQNWAFHAASLAASGNAPPPGAFPTAATS